MALADIAASTPIASPRQCVNRHSPPAPPMIDDDPFNLGGLALAVVGSMLTATAVIGLIVYLVAT